MNVVMIIPTGIGAEIGGHAGDGTPAAKLLASVCDKLIIHPNVVNGSDLNEMTENMLYVEGSQLDEFLDGKISLKQVKSNRILLVVNAPVKNEIVNSVNAARVCLGVEIIIMELNKPLELNAIKNEDGQVSGRIDGWRSLVRQVRSFLLDNDGCWALAVNTPITCDLEVAKEYMQGIGGVNPWGGVEAVVSKLIAKQLQIPVAHAPNGHVISSTYDEIVDPRMSAEMVSCCYLQCILKGLHKAPQLYDFGTSDMITNNDIDFLISPAGCYGKPHKICEQRGIPIIVVDENKTCFNRKIPNAIHVLNYIEATGLIQLKKIGITIESVTRPMTKVKIFRTSQV